MRFIGVRRRTVRAAAAVLAAPKEEVKEFVLPTWAEFEFGMAPVYWKTMNGLPPTAGQNYGSFTIQLLQNSNLTKIMASLSMVDLISRSCVVASQEPCLLKPEAKSIHLSTPFRYAFLSTGLAEELGKEGACDEAIIPDTSIVVTKCAMIGNLTIKGTRTRLCITRGQCRRRIVPALFKF